MMKKQFLDMCKENAFKQNAYQSKRTCKCTKFRSEYMALSMFMFDPLYSIEIQPSFLKDTSIMMKKYFLDICKENAFKQNAYQSKTTCNCTKFQLEFMALSMFMFDPLYSKARRR